MLAKIFIYSVFWFLFTSKLIDCEYCPFFLFGIYQTLYDPSQGHICHHHRDHVKPLDSSFVLHIESIEDTYYFFVIQKNLRRMCLCYELKEKQYLIIIKILFQGIYQNSVHSYSLPSPPKLCNY